MTKRFAEKLFKFLNIYENLRDTILAIDGLFQDECEDELKAKTKTAQIRHGEAAIFIFCDLENSIKADTMKTPIPGGAVHPLTHYMMNYLKYTYEYLLSPSISSLYFSWTHPLNLPSSICDGVRV